MDTSVPTVQREKTMRLAGGGSVTIRRLQRSEKSRALAAAEFVDGNLGAQAIFVELAIRKGITSAEGIILDGAEVTTLWVNEPRLNKIASEQVFNAMSDEEVATAAAFVLNGTELPGDMLGK